MNIRPISVSRQALKSFPKVFYDMLENDQALIISGEEDGEELCYAFFACVPKNEKVAILVYVGGPGIDVVDGEESYELQQSRIRELIRESKRILFNNGFVAIEFKYAEDFEWVDFTTNILAEEDFIPISFSGECLEYRLGEIAERDQVKLLQNADRRILPKIVKLAPEDVRLRHFFSSSDEKGVVMDIKDYQEEFSFFHIRDNEICAALLGERLSGKMLFVPTIYCDNHPMSAAAIPVMIAELIREAEKTLDSDAIMSFQSFEFNIESGIRGVLGDRYDRYDIGEYVCVKGVERHVVQSE